MSKLLDYFSYDYCRFSCHKSKESTARIALYKDLKITNIFTMEASFCGANQGQHKGMHFGTSHLKKAGETLLHALIVYCGINVQHSMEQIATLKKMKATERSSNDLEGLDRERLMDELMKNKELVEEVADSSDGSDSEPSEDNLDEEDIKKYLPIKIVKKKNNNNNKKQVKKVEKPKEEPKPEPPKLPVKKPAVRRISSFNDRMRLRGMRKVEMVDAWT